MIEGFKFRGGRELYSDFSALLTNPLQGHECLPSLEFCGWKLRDFSRFDNFVVESSHLVCMHAFQGIRFRVQDPGFIPRIPLSSSIYGCTCTTPNMSGFPDILGLKSTEQVPEEFRVEGLGLRLKGLGSRVSSLGLFILTKVCNFCNPSALVKQNVVRLEVPENQGLGFRV
jgi:hypothetical protein